MPLVSGSIPNFVQGVSQQAPALRLPSQCEEQENGVPSLVEGLLKRPPLEYIAELAASSKSGAKIHFATRDLTERYVFILTDGDLEIYDRDTGAAKTVNFPDGKAYLNTADPRGNFRLQTIADTTFLVNKESVVAMDSATTPDQDFQALVAVKEGVFNSRYVIYVDGSEVANVVTGEASGDDATDTIADSLKTALDANLPAGFTATLYGSSILIKKNDGTEFDISTWDSRADEALTVATDRVQRFSNLPHVAPHGYKVEVVGDQSNDFNNYWVEFDANDTGSTVGSEGVWKETIKPGIQYKLDPSTMPHLIVRESNGEFTFKEATWGEREAGDTDSVSEPSFVGKSLNSVFFTYNRVGFLSDDNAVLSRTGGYFNFWPQTAKTVLDSDPVDLGASHPKVAILHAAIPFDKQTVIFSDQSQWVLRGGQIFTPKNASLDILSEYEADPKSDPVSAANTVFFAAPRGGFTSLYEMEIVDDTERAEAFDASEHVPKYIPEGVHKITASKTENTLVGLSENDASTLYAYNWHWTRRSKDQAAWHKFTLNGAEVLDVEFFGSNLWAVLVKEGKTILCRLKLDPGQTDTDQTFLTRLDYKVDETACSVSYDSGSDTTTITLPVPMDNPQVVLRGSSQGVVKHTGTSGVVSQIAVSGDLSASEFFVGEPFLWRYRLSQIFYKPQKRDGSGGAAVPGRLTVKNMLLTYDDTGYFEVHVTPKYRTTSIYKFTGKIIGQGENKIGDVSIRTGEFRYKVGSKSDRVTVEYQSDSFLPVNILSAAWSGMLTETPRVR